MADRIVHSYTTPSWRLELRAQSSPLSRWAGKPVIKHVRFQLHQILENAPAQLKLKGNRDVLEQFYEATTAYVQSQLQRSPLTFAALLAPPGELSGELPGELPEPAVEELSGDRVGDREAAGAAESTARVGGEPMATMLETAPASPFRWQTIGQLNHQLTYQPADLGLMSEEWLFSTLELFDLAEVLDNWNSSSVSLPSLETPAAAWKWGDPTPNWARLAASIVVATGVTGAGVYLLSQGAGQIAKQIRPNASEAQIASAPDSAASPFAGGLPPVLDPSQLQTPATIAPVAPSQPTLPPDGSATSDVATGTVATAAAPSLAGTVPPPPPPGSTLSAGGGQMSMGQTGTGQTAMGRTIVIPPPTQPRDPGKELENSSAPDAIAAAKSEPMPAPPVPPPMPNPPLPPQPPEMEQAMPDMPPPPPDPPDLEVADAAGPASNAGAQNAQLATGTAATLRAGSAPAAPNLGPVQEVKIRNPLPPTAQVQEVQGFFQQRWQGIPNVPQPLQYRLNVRPDGALGAVTPLSNAAARMVDRIGVPLLGESFVSPSADGSSPTVVVTLRSNGSAEVVLEKLATPPAAREVVPPQPAPPP